MDCENSVDVLADCKNLVYAVDSENYPNLLANAVDSKNSVDAVDCENSVYAVDSEN